MFFTYDKDNGRILTSGYSCSPELLETLDVGVVVGQNAKPAQQYFLGGVLIDVPLSPGSGYIWDWDVRQWCYNRDMAYYAMERAVQSVLDTTARANGNWDNMLSARAAAAFENSFQSQALTLAVWWAAVWTACHQILADVDANVRPIPTVEELLAELPVYQI